VTFTPFHHLTLRVVQVHSFGSAIKRIVLQDPDGWELPPFEAGAHLDICLTQGGVRQFSLSGDPAARERYEIAVQASREGRGGSAWLHDRVAAGDTLYASLPRNHFRLDPAYRRFILIAGGIGITPLRSMTFELERSGTPYELWYCARQEAAAAYVEDLRARIPRGRLHLVFDEGAPGRQLDAAALLGDVQADTAVYCCGPASFMDAVRQATRHWPEAAVRFEAFSPPQAADVIPTREFDVRLARTGLTIPVRRGQSVLQALREHNIDVQSSCEAGVCRSCKTSFLEGSPVHRDLVLNAEERRSSMLICVSGCSSERLVLDL
jgi:vanillate O-demethylase ferredoxin subunit